MDWFKPTTETIAFVAESCLTSVMLGYLLTLKQKNKVSYLYIGFMFCFFIYAFVNIFYTASFPVISFFLKFCNGASFGLLAYCWLIIAFYFPKNYHPKEGIAALLLLLIPTVYTWFSAEPDQFTLGTLSAYTLELIYISLLYKRKIRQAEKEFKTNSAVSQIQFEREKNFYKGSILAILFDLTIFITLYFVVFNLLSNFAWIIILHIITLATFTILTYSILNYTQQSTSFRAKLTGIILCVGLIVLELLPFMLLGSMWIDQTGNKTINESGRALPQKIIYDYIIVIPVVTILIVTLFPLLLKNVILQPLNKILSGVQEVNSGKLDTEIMIEVNDEIGVLSYNFNQMTSSLKRYADKMSDLVDERTAQLNQSLQELKSTQAQLIQSEKMASLGELTAGIAHEIQNPLNFVNNFSEVSRELIEEMQSERLKVNGERDEQLEEELLTDIKQNLEKINHHGKRADAIVKGMLQHSRQTKSVRELTDINALCDEYLRLSYHGLRAKDKSFNADFTTNFDQTIGKINIVPQDMGRVILNLFNNAFYATSEKQKVKSLTQKEYKPMVSVTTRRLYSPSGAGGIEITVKDNGNGIPKNVIDKIFQPFFTTKPTGQGTGLGLSLSYDIITKEHGGTIKVESKEGEGTTFIIQI